MSISLVVAVSTNNAIGKNNQLLWTLPNDMRFFKNTTWAMPVVMGRKTFEALGKPLNGRFNIVISKQKDFKHEGTTVVDSLEEAIKISYDAEYHEVMVIGGGQIYKQAMPMADKLYLTRVDAELEGDTSFPEINTQVWEMISQETHTADEKHAYAYHFQVWERIKR
jgi:dihydrofolate reductase